MDGAIFFRSRSVKVRRFGAWCGRLSSPVSPLPHHHLRPAGRGLCLVIFFLSPCPLLRVLPCLRVSISPPPPGVGCANGRTICGCGRDGGLLAFIVSCRSLAERSFAFVLPDVRVFLSCLVFPAYRVGSRWSSSGPVLVSPRVSRPVRFLLRACFPPSSHPSGSVDSSFLARSSSLSALLVSCLVSLRLAVPPVPIVGLLASLVSVSWRSCPSCGLVSVLPRSAYLPALLVVGRGGLLCRCFLSSRAVRCLEFRSS